MEDKESCCDSMQFDAIQSDDLPYYVAENPLADLYFGEPSMLLQAPHNEEFFSFEQRNSSEESFFQMMSPTNSLVEEDDFKIDLVDKFFYWTIIQLSQALTSRSNSWVVGLSSNYI